MLLYWLPQGTHSLPGNATHRVGIGAFVMNDRREVIPYILIIEMLVTILHLRCVPHL